MTFVLGLTGSIGMGKSTTAAMFADLGVPVWDADASVRRLYAAGGAGARALAERFPQAIENGAVSRSRLRAMITAEPGILDQVQSLIHPLVADDRADFLAQSDAPVVVLDVPLLFETGLENGCDAVAVVSVEADVQRERVLARDGMTEEEFELILSRQMPDEEKRARARWVILTETLDGALMQVRDILQEIAKETPRA